MKMKYDAIVIGSGIGGLIAGGILSKYNKKKVLMLEKHYEIGGLTHEFRRGPYSWDVGVHYLGRAIKERLGDSIFKYLTEGRIKWNEIHGVYDTFMYPDFTLEISADWQKHIDDLVKIFPDEKKGIYKYFKDIKKGRAWYVRYFLISVAPLFIRLPLRLINSLTKPLALSRVGDYLDKNFRDQRLKAALISRWGNQGLPPKESAFCMQALIDYHYMCGAFFPDKGAEKICLMIEKTIENSNGAIMANKEVTEIIVKNNKAIGVKYWDLSNPDQGIREAFAPVIISNTGAWSTYLKLLPDTLNLGIQRKLKDFFPGYSSVTLFLGLKKSPEKIGLNASNLWIYDTYDHDEVVKVEEGLLKGNAKCAFVSFPSLKNNKAGAHTAEIVTLVPYSIFASWKDQKWKRRSADYYKLKDSIIESLLSLVESRVPGFRDLIAYKELATPLTLEHFTGKAYGSLYNLPATPDRYTLKDFGPKTPIKNLYLSGADASSLGFMGAVMGGLAAASVVNGPFGLFKLVGGMSRAGRRGFKDRQAVADNTISENKVKATVIGKETIKNGVIKVILNIETDIPFTPGDHVKLKIADIDWRSYTITDIDDSRISFLIDTKHEGAGSRYIRNLQIKDTTMVRLTMNDFVLRNFERNIIFFTSGVGIAPFLSIFQELEKKKYDKKLRMYFGSVDEEGVFVNDLLKPYINSLKLDVQYCVDNLVNGSGYFHGTVIDAFNKDKLDVNDYDFYSCGHPHMVRAVNRMLREKGAENIYW